MSTIKETILSFPGLSDSGKFIDKILVDRSLDGAANYSVDVKEAVNLAAADLYKFVVNLPDFTENELSLKYPRSYFINTAKALYRDNGEPENAANVVAQIKVPRGKANSSW